MVNWLESQNQCEKNCRGCHCYALCVQFQINGCFTISGTYYKINNLRNKCHLQRHQAKKMAISKATDHIKNGKKNTTKRFSRKLFKAHFNMCVLDLSNALLWIYLNFFFACIFLLFVFLCRIRVWVLGNRPVRTFTFDHSKSSKNRHFYGRQQLSCCPCSFLRHFISIWRW